MTKRFRKFLFIIKNQDFIAILCLFLITVIFFARLFIPEPKIFATAEIGINDIWYYNYPMKNFLHESLSKNKLPLWNINMGGGFPVLAEGQIGTFNLYNLIAFKFLPTIYAFNLGFLFIFFQTALGTYLFSRRLSLFPLTSFLIALTFSFSGFFITHISHFMVIQAASYMPLIFLAVDLLLSRITISRVIFLIFLISQQIFAGFQQIVLITLVGIFLYVVYKIKYQKLPWSRLILMVCCICVGFIFSAAQIIPSYELMRISNRAGTNIQEVLRWTYPPEHLLSLINPFIFGNPQNGSYPHFNDFKGSLFWENTGYVGIIPLILALYSLIRFSKYHRQLKVFCLFLLGSSFLLMIGRNGPLYFLLTFPPFVFFRFPSRFLLLFVWALVLFTGLGFQQLDNKLSNFKYRHIFRWLILGMVIFDLSLTWFNYHTTVKYQEFINDPETVKTIKKEPYGRVYTYLANARTFNEFFDSGSNQPERYLDLRNELAPNLNMVYGIQTVDAYAALLPQRHAHYYAQLASTYKISTSSANMDPQNLKLISLRNTTHVISPISLTNSNLKLINSYKLATLPGEQFVYLYRNTAALPKYYLVDSHRQITTLEDFVTTMNNDDFDIQKEILVEKKINLLQDTNLLKYQTKVLKESDTEIELLVNTNKPAILVATNSYYPGWKVFVDDQALEVFPVNLINQGVILKPGNNNVRFIFTSSALNKGLLISLAGYLLIFGLLISQFFRFIMQKLNYLHEKS